ncbi:MAG: hypothetical protein AAF602_21330 [Myxococcota bacterium]
MRVFGTIPPARVAELREWLGEPTTLARVIAVLDRDSLGLSELIPMDEYTIDVLVDLPEGLTLVFDTT